MSLDTRIKICGCASPEDAQLAVDAGADAVGVILAPESPRYVGIARLREIAAVLPAFVALVAVFVDPADALVEEALAAGALPQFHGDEPADACEAFTSGPYIKAFHVDAAQPLGGAAFDRFAQPYARATWLFDTARPEGGSGGTGRVFRWEQARRLAGERRFIVSGGLTPENVAACITAIGPYAVDVRSGVETNGAKDRDKVRAFVQAVREADAARAGAVRA